MRSSSTRGDDSGGHEVHLIVERSDGGMMAPEVKLASTVDDGDLRHLRRLTERAEPRLADAAVVTTGQKAYRQRDEIGVISAALIGP